MSRTCSAAAFTVSKGARCGSASHHTLLSQVILKPFGAEEIWIQPLLPSFDDQRFATNNDMTQHELFETLDRVLFQRLIR